MASPDPSLIVITCAAGRQNAYLLPHLTTHPNTTLRLIVHSESSRARLSAQYPPAEVLTADLRQPATLFPILRGATHAYHVGPGFHPHETQLGYNFIDAAVAESRREGNRFRHFVYSSVLNTPLRKLLNHDCKRYVEEYLLESGLNWTILQPTNFMNKQILLALYKQPGREAGEPATYAAAWDPDLKFSMVALPDLGEVGAMVLREGEKHYMAQYPLASPPLTSYREMVGVLGGVMGMEVRVVRKEFGEAVEGF